MFRPGALFMLIAILTIGLSYSCKKDKEDSYDGSPTGSGTLIYQGKSYAISFGLYEDYGFYDGIHYYELYLFSSGVNLDEETGYGNIAAIYFSTYTAPLSTGTIPYYSEGIEPVPAVEAQVGLDYNLETEVGTDLYAFVDGEINISKSDDNYNIQFTFILQGGGTLTGQYTGRIFEF